MQEEETKKKKAGGGAPTRTVTQKPLNQADIENDNKIQVIKSFVSRLADKKYMNGD